jgi:L,D-transpeptidase YbiS
MNDTAGPSTPFPEKPAPINPRANSVRGTVQNESTPAISPAAEISKAKPIRQVLGSGLLLGLVLATLTLLAAPVLREWAFALWPDRSVEGISGPESAKLKREVSRLERLVVSLQKRYEWLTPRTPYLIVNTSENRIYIKSGNKLLHEGVCSTGSYVLLKASGDRQWVFFTPRGMFRILGKEEWPVWRKPDWAFVEEGLPIPAPYARERYEAGVLGEYALEIGDGYLIHGTLYKRLLGMPVTHGCVRLDDEDLRIVYHSLQFGSKVFIY